MNDRAKRTAPTRYRLAFGCVFYKRWAGFPQYMTSQNSVPWVVIRNVAGGAP